MSYLTWVFSLLLLDLALDRVAGDRVREADRSHSQMMRPPISLPLFPFRALKLVLIRWIIPIMRPNIFQDHFIR